MLQKLPKGQATHSLEEEVPTKSVEGVCLGHSTQLVCPVLVWYVPSSQGTHGSTRLEPVVEKNPLPQYVGTVTVMLTVKT